VLFSNRQSVINVSIACLIPFVFTVSATARQSTPSTDLAAMIELIDQERYSSLAEAKQLREKNLQNRQFTPLFDFSYALSLVKFGRWQDAVEVLQPFVDNRPQVYQARLLLIRCFIELDKLDNVVVETEKLLDKLPGDAEAAEDVIQTTGLIVGYFSFARKDCPDELKIRLDDLAKKKTPEPLQAKLLQSISLVESKVTSIQEELDKAAEKAEATTESKIANSLEEAERLRAEAEAKAAELESREKSRAEKFEQVKQELNKMELEYGKFATRQSFLDNQINAIRQNMFLLERQVTIEDQNGNRTTTTEITDQVQYTRLNLMARDTMNEMRNLEANGRVLLNSYQQLQSQARGLADQKQLDELFTKSKMNQLSNEAQAKQKRAEREADRKGKRPPTVARGLNAKLKSYSTYDALDVAGNKQYLQGISQRFLPKN
jgi:hypothetical protein